MAPLGQVANPREGAAGLNSRDGSFRMQTVYGSNDDETRHPASPSVQYSRSWSKANAEGNHPHLPSVPFNSPALPALSDRCCDDDTASQIRIRQLRQNKRRAEKGFCEVRCQIDSLQEENDALRAENEELRAQQLEYAAMMRRASEALRAMEEERGLDQDDDVSEQEGDIEAENDDDDDLLVSSKKSALEMTLLNNKLTIEFLDDDCQRSMTEMHERLQNMASEVTELKAEKAGLIEHSHAQDAALATLEEQNELKAAKIDILESLVRSLMKDRQQQHQEPDAFSSEEVAQADEDDFPSREDDGGFSCSLRSNQPNGDPQHDEKNANKPSWSTSNSTEKSPKQVEPASSVTPVDDDTSQECNGMLLPPPPPPPFGDYTSDKDSDDQSVCSCEPTLEPIDACPKVSETPKSVLTPNNTRRSILSPKSARRMASAAKRLFTLKAKTPPPTPITGKEKTQIPKSDVRFA